MTPSFHPHAFRAAAVAAVAILGLAAAGPADECGPVTVEMIAASHDQQRAATRSILVEWEAKSSGTKVAPPPGKTLTLPKLLGEEFTFAAKGDQRYHKVVSRFEKVTPGLTTNRTMVFDGKALKELRPAAAAPGKPKLGAQDQILVRVVRKDDLCYFPNRYPWAVGIGLSDPGEKQPGSITRVHDLPTLLRTGGFAVTQKDAVVDGAACLLAESPGVQKIWLDPALHYAVRRREVYQNGVTESVITCRQFKQVPDSETWLPASVSWTTYEGGKVAQQLDLTLRRAEVNKPSHDALFQIDAKPGSLVIDETLASDGSKVSREAGTRTPSVSYTQPANPADLDAVVAKAKETHDAGRRSTRWQVLYWGLGFAALATVVGLGGRWWLRRRGAEVTKEVTP